jgi:hypothetical protein
MNKFFNITEILKKPEENDHEDTCIIATQYLENQNYL